MIEKYIAQYKVRYLQRENTVIVQIWFDDWLFVPSDVDPVYGKKQLSLFLKFEVMYCQVII